MPKCYLHIMFLVCLLMSCFQGLSQSGNPSVQVQAAATESSIKLRWAPDAPAAWKLAHKYGYSIERITLSVNGKLSNEPERIILNSSPILPAAEPIWTREMDDDYVAIAAQAIYGEDFEVAPTNQSEIVRVINKAKELESRFSFCVFACDISIKAAELSGLYFEDKTVSEGSKYLYRIYTHVPLQIQKIDTGFVYVGLQDYLPLPVVPDVRVKFGDGQALISWNGTLHEKIYNSFWVERSDDGKSFKRITQQPIINAFQGDRPKTELVFRTDTLPSNDVEYFYRVIGVSAFGETGPPSEIVSGMGRPSFAFSATINAHEILPAGGVKLEWEFPAKGATLIKSFDLLKLNPQTKVHTEIRKDILSTERTVVDEKPSSTNYYVIRACDEFGRTNNSFPYLVQTEDSIPPLPPVGLKGRIDTLGRVFISWEPNKEDDLLGYAIYKANFKSDEFIQKPGPYFVETEFIDTVKLTTLTEKIYYKVRAIDNRFNPSKLSVILELEKPDRIPPVPPVFQKIKSDSTGITVTWNPSGSEDVTHHVLYRRSAIEKDWTFMKLFEVFDTVQSYSDHAVSHKMEYAYTMIAVDDDALESVPASPVTAAFVSNEPFPKVKDIFYSLDKDKKSVTLSWNYQYESVDRFFIYRSFNDGPLALYRSVEGDVKEINDSYSPNQTKIQYRIVAGFRTGERTRLSQPVILTP